MKSVSPKTFRHWLDPIIEQQANHYGLPVDTFKGLMADAAVCQEELEKQNADKPNELV